MTIHEIASLMDANATICIKNGETNKDIETIAYNVNHMMILEQKEFAQRRN